MAEVLFTVKVELEDGDDLQNSLQIPGSGTAGSHHGNMVTVKMEPIHDIAIKQEEDFADSTSRNGGNMVAVKMEPVNDITPREANELADSSLNGDNIGTSSDVSTFSSDRVQPSSWRPTLEETIVEEPDGTVTDKMQGRKHTGIDDSTKRFAEELDGRQGQSMKRTIWDSGSLVETAKRVPVKTTFADYEVEGEQSSIVTEPCGSNVPSDSNFKTKRTKGMTAQQSGATEPSQHAIPKMAMTSGSSNLSNDTCVSSSFHVNLETTQAKVERLEKKLHEGRQIIQDLHKRLENYNQIPKEVIHHTDKLYGLLQQLRRHAPYLTFSHIHKENIWPSTAPQLLKTPFQSISTLAQQSPVPTSVTAIVDPLVTPCLHTPQELQPAVMSTLNPSAPQTAPQTTPQSPLVHLLITTPSSQPSSSLSQVPTSGEDTMQHVALRPLIVDPREPTKYETALVDPYMLHQLEMKTLGRGGKHSVVQHLNSTIKMVFSSEELSCSTGLGLRMPKDGTTTSRPLNAMKVKAVKEYMKSFCNRNQLEEIEERTINRKFTYKITNARREPRNIEQ